MPPASPSTRTRTSVRAKQERRSHKDYSRAAASLSISYPKAPTILSSIPFPPTLALSTRLSPSPLSQDASVAIQPISRWPIELRSPRSTTCSQPAVPSHLHSCKREPLSSTFQPPCRQEQAIISQN